MAAYRRIGVALALLIEFPLHAQGKSPDELIRYIHALDKYRALRHYKSAPAFSDAEYRDALNGKAMARMADTSGGENMGMAIKVFNAPIWKVWATVADRGHYTEFSEKLKTSAILDKTDGTVTVYHYAKIHPLVSDRQWVLDTHANNAIHERSHGEIWEYFWAVNPRSKALIEQALKDGKIKNVSAKDSEEAVTLSKNEGSFFIVALPDGRTLVEGFSFNDPGGNIPRWIADSQTAKEIPITFEKMEAFIHRKFGTHMTLQHESIIGPEGKLLPPGSLGAAKR